jgi:general secretion pathway protein G
VDTGQIGGSDVRLGSEGYPPALETLVKGVNQVGRLDHKLKFLRRIPRDPLSASDEWGLRCYQDDPDTPAGAARTCGTSTAQPGQGPGRTKYSDW